nr:hypothetical protein [uncultured bacterium]AOE09778.1 hypothetical protein [uncultured bacterium]
MGTLCHELGGYVLRLEYSIFVALQKNKIFWFSNGCVLSHFHCYFVSYRDVSLYNDRQCIGLF